MKIVTILALLLVTPVFVHGQGLEQLSSARSKIQFPKTSDSDRKKILSSFKLVFSDLYVNRDLKIYQFGKEVDPLPKISDVEQNLSIFSDEKFYSSLSLAVSALRDAHTKFFLPKPYSCYETLRPFALVPVVDENKKKVVTVRSILNDPKYKELFPEIDQISIGDVVTKIDGAGVFDKISSLSGISYGANEPSLLRRGAQMLTLVRQSSTLLPPENSSIFEFLRKDGKVYSLSVPWISKADQKCLEEVVPPSGGSAPSLEVGEDLEQRYFEKIFGRPKFISKKLTKNLTSKEPSLEYGLLVKGGKTFGLLRVSGFGPSGKSTIFDWINESRRILSVEFKDTEGVIVDVRGNGGGYLLLGEELAHLFSSREISPMKLTLLQSPGNKHLVGFSSRIQKPFVQAFTLSENNFQKYIEPTPLYSPSQINSGGQAYFRPVAVLTNSRCFSSCETFVAQMQDHGLATIWGEDETTGGGGANNYSLSDFYKFLPQNQKGPFEILPFGQDIGISWRQVRRVDNNPYESTGVLSEKISPALLSDLRDGTNLQMDLILDALFLESQKEFSNLKLQTETLDIFAGQSMSILASWENVDSIEVLNPTEMIFSKNLEGGSSGGDFVLVEMPHEVASKLPKNGRLTVRGMRSGKPVSVSYLNFRKIPQALVIEDSDSVIDFEKRVQLYTYGASSEEGFQYSNGILKTGISDFYPNVKEYPQLAKIQASVFLDLSNRKKPINLDFKMKLATEADHDNFQVKAVSYGQVTPLITPVSGSQDLSPFSFSLDPFLGSQVEIQLELRSDLQPGGEGVTVQDLMLTSPQ